MAMNGRMSLPREAPTSGTDSRRAGAVDGGGASVDAGDVARRRFLSIARQRAAHFAHFDDSSRLSSARRTAPRETSPVAGASAPSASAEAAATAGERGGRVRRIGGEARGPGEAEQWPGPFATARQLVRGRAAAAAARQAQGGGGARTGESAGERVGGESIAQGSEAGATRARGTGTTGTVSSTVPAGVAVSWTPKSQSQRETGGGGTDHRSGGGGSGRAPRSLYSLCLHVVSEHIEALESLEGVPDGVRRDLSACLSALRRLDGRALALLVGGVAAELAVADCSLVGEADLHRALTMCDPAKLELVHLSMCGRSLSDTCLTSTLLRAPASLPALRSLSLQGAYRLSDAALPPLALAAPSLAHLSLLHCPLLSSPAVSTLLSSLASSLKTLRLDGCSQLNARALLPGLKALTGLTCLSLAGVPSVTDAVLADLLPAVGGHLKELSLAHCEAVTDESVAAAAAHAPSLTALDLSHLPLLSDNALHSLCSAQLKLRSLNLTRTNFSDSALASLIQSSGAALHTLSVNAVYEAADGLLVALACSAHESLQALDVSWCRSMSDHGLGLLADSCPNLSRLCLYGCSQVSDVFYLGHSNTSLQLVGQVGMHAPLFGAHCNQFPVEQCPLGAQVVAAPFSHQSPSPSFVHHHSRQQHDSATLCDENPSLDLFAEAAEFLSLLDAITPDDSQSNGTPIGSTDSQQHRDANFLHHQHQQQQHQQQQQRQQLSSAPFSPPASAADPATPISVSASGGSASLSAAPDESVGGGGAMTAAAALANPVSPRHGDSSLNELGLFRSLEAACATEVSHYEAAACTAAGGSGGPSDDPIDAFLGTLLLANPECGGGDARAAPCPPASVARDHDPPLQGAAETRAQQQQQLVITTPEGNEALHEWVPCLPMHVRSGSEGEPACAGTGWSDSAVGEMSMGGSKAGGMGVAEDNAQQVEEGSAPPVALTGADLFGAARVEGSGVGSGATSREQSEDSASGEGNAAVADADDFLGAAIAGVWGKQQAGELLVAQQQQQGKNNSSNNVNSVSSHSSDGNSQQQQEQQQQQQQAVSGSTPRARQLPNLSGRLAALISQISHATTAKAKRRAGHDAATTAAGHARPAGMGPGHSPAGGMMKMHEQAGVADGSEERGRESVLGVHGRVRGGDGGRLAYGRGGGGGAQEAHGEESGSKRRAVQGREGAPGLTAAERIAWQVPPSAALSNQHPAAPTATPAFPPKPTTGAAAAAAASTGAGAAVVPSVPHAWVLAGAGPDGLAGEVDPFVLAEHISRCAPALALAPAMLAAPHDPLAALHLQPPSLAAVPYTRASSQALPVASASHSLAYHSLLSGAAAISSRLTGAFASGKSDVGMDEVKQLVLALAEAIATKDMERVAGLRARVAAAACAEGRPGQRVAHCFLDALTTRLHGTGALRLYNAAFTSQ
ncbi:unnamed protein product, partial [Closterium sp. Yama58-4]